MKTLVLAPPLEPIGGIQRFTALLASALGDVLGRANVRLEAIPAPAPQGQGQKASGRLPWRLKAGFVARVAREAAKWKPALCVATHVGLAPVAALLHGATRCPYWVVAHGIEVWGRLPRAKKWALRRAARVLAVSAFTQKRLVEFHGLDQDRIVLFPDVADDALRGAAPDTGALERLHLGRSKCILSVARLAADERYKGIDIVLHALPLIQKQVPDVRYMIVGEGDDRPRLERLAHELGSGATVTFLGRVSDAALAACYDRCDAFVLPSRTVLDATNPKGEGFGIAYLEAMLFGKPVVGPDRGAPTEFIRHGENGLLADPESPKEIAGALIELLADGERARRMGAQGRRLAETEYSQEAMKRRLERLLEGFAARE